MSRRLRPALDLVNTIGAAAADLSAHGDDQARATLACVSDLFHQDVPDAFIDQVFAAMALNPRHTFQILTKRADRMRAYCATLGRHHESDRVSLAAKAMQPDGPGFFWTMRPGGWCLDNVWLGVSVENQHFADERIPLLLQTPAAVRFISAEPLLGPVDLKPYVDGACLPCGLPDLDCAAFRSEAGGDDGACCNLCQHRPALDWVIVGGESGPGARPMDLAWARSIVQQCKAAGVPCFVKQLGRFSIQDGVYPDGGRTPAANGSQFGLRDRKGGNPDEVAHRPTRARVPRGCAQVNPEAFAWLRDRLLDITRQPDGLHTPPCPSCQMLRDLRTLEIAGLVAIESDAAGVVRCRPTESSS